MHYQIDALGAYSLCNLDSCLFPLNQWDATKEGKKGQRVELGKTPLHKGWSKGNTSEAQILTHIQGGGNVGFRIPKDWIVIDLDPRNYPSGADAMDIQDQVAELLGFFDWEEIEWDYNLVRTGSGGYHIYCQLPDCDIYKRVRTKLKGLAGVDIKRHGGYVVAAGSRHPNGDHYTWESELSLGSTVKLEGAALEGLLREVSGSAGDHESYGALNGTELQSAVLDRLNPGDFGDNDSWFPLMCACHFVTAGAGVEEFVEWSCADPTYADDAEKIRYRWDSLDERRSEANTAGTLIYELKQRGEDFSELMGLLGRNDFDDLDDFDTPGLVKADQTIVKSIKSGALIDQAIEEQLPEYQDVLDAKAEPTLLENEIMALPDSLGAENDEALNRIGRLLHTVNPAGSIRANALLRNKGLSTSEINKLKKENAPAPIDDLPALVRDSLWNGAFNKGKGIFLMGGELYRFSQTHWSVLPATRYRYLAEMVIDGLRTKGVDVQRDLASTVEKAYQLAQNQADQIDHGKQVRAASTRGIVNCLDCEVHINEHTGELKKKPHNPKSYQMSCLDIEFGDEPLEDYATMCPKFLRRMNEWFGGLDDTAEMIDFVQELFGYIMQPNKDLAYIWLFHGSGGNGKSTLLKILENLLGESTYAAESSIFDSITGKGDGHETSSLPGKLLISIEDMDSEYKIKDGPMKRLSASSDFTANPKFKDRVKFRHTASVVMCSNGYPRLASSDDGAARRLMVVPFKNGYVNAGQGQRLINVVDEVCSDPRERAGILRWALLGLRRLRQRGDFKRPPSCELAKASWESEGNVVRAFIASELERVPREERPRNLKNGKDIPLCTSNELYEKFEEWCAMMGIGDEFIIKQYRFNKELDRMSGIDVRRSVVGRRQIVSVFGFKFKYPSEDFSEIKDFEDEDF